MEFVRAIVNVFFLPPVANLLLLFTGLAALPRAPRLARALLWTGSATLMILAMPIVGSALTRATGQFDVFDGRDPAAQAIVVLGAERRSAPEFGGLAVGTHTLERLRLGAQLARQTGLPVLFSGGRQDPKDAESTAELMGREFRTEFGLSARWIEGDSRNTWENAQRSAAILRGAGIHNVVVVTHYVHMQRALADFAAAGITARAAPTHFPVLTFSGVADALLPSIRGLEDSAAGLHELFGLLGRSLGAPM